MNIQKKVLPIRGESCSVCNKQTLYELDVPKQDIICNKIFCASCEICCECEKEISNPNNLCKKCYCPICGIEYYFTISHTDFDSIDENNKDEWRKHHVDSCEQKRQRELDMFNSLASMDLN